MKIDVLLINARTGKQIPAYIPNGLLWVAAVLRDNNFEVQILDRNTNDDAIEKILSRLNPKIVGVSTLTGEVILDAIDLSKRVRFNTPNIPIVWGGLHPTLFPDSVLNEAYVDYIVMGEGEYPMLELTKHLLNNQYTIGQIQNIGYKENGIIKLNSMRDFIDMDKLPMPAFDLINMNNYMLFRPYARKTICLMTSRGCPYNCTFCYNKKVNKGKWRGMSAEKVIDLIKHIKTEYNIDGFLFHDDNFDENPTRLKKICEMLIENKIDIKWEHCSRVNYANKKRLALEKKAGCEVIAYGLESGSERILKLVQKGQTVPQIENAINLCRETGISTSVGSIIGYPFEKKEDLEETIELFERLRPTHVFTTIYNPYPGSDLYDYVVREGLFKEPETLEEQGKIYAVENYHLNMSSIPNEDLREIVYKYSTRNLLNEAKDYIKFRNFKGLLKITFKYLQRPGATRKLYGRYIDIFKSWFKRIPRKDNQT